MAVAISKRVGISFGTGSSTRAETIVAAHCESGAGSPPSGVYGVIGGGASASVVATLVPATAQVLVSALAVTSSRLELTGQGYSSANVPRCCPDRTVRMAWTANRTTLVRVQ